MQSITIQQDDSGQRLDRYLRKLLKQAPLSLIHKLIRTKKVKVSGKAQKKDYKLQVGNELVLFIRDPEYKAFTIGTKSERFVEKITFEIVYEDEDVLVVNKPAGLPSQPGTGYEGASLIDEVLHYLSDTSDLQIDKITSRSSTTFRPALANRLDRGTSGLILVGKTAAALRDLNKQLAEGSVEKTYLALVHGIPSPDHGTIDVALEATDQPNPDAPKMLLGSGKTAVTHYRVQKKFKDTSLLEIIIETGRTHQIRAHLASIGHPVVGDQRYGKDSEEQLMLHSWKVTFTHPGSGRMVTLEAPIPSRMKFKTQN